MSTDTLYEKCFMENFPLYKERKEKASKVLLKEGEKKASKVLSKEGKGFYGVIAIPFMGKTTKGVLF